ncbi:MAG: 50S ribosomal protein L5 [Anaerolineaceae bacterium]|nr:50S ribosomal protein L5 [Anaerolineaceae bacterium]
MKNVLEQKYIDEVKPALMKELGFTNPMQAPRIEKVVVNIGLGEALDNPKALEAAVGDLTTITGQKPVVIKARKSIANFKLREGREIGAKVTLRSYKMWSFLDRLVNVALPRVRDFRGIPGKSFDGRGNYTLGLREQLIFPEIDFDKIDKVRGMEITIVTSAQSDEQAYKLLDMLGMPFNKDEE